MLIFFDCGVETAIKFYETQHFIYTLTHPTLPAVYIGETLKCHSPTRATLDKPTFHTFPYKTWRTVYIRNKKLAWLEG